MTLLEIARMTEDEARRYLEGLRWPDGPVCPHCESTDCTRLDGDAHRPGVFQCNNGECRQQFTVTVKSVLESSKVSLCKWVMAFHLICSSKKGFSALQLQRELGLGSYRTAWFMMHRIRHALSEGELTEPTMTGPTEADESYFGGKPRPAHKGAKEPPAKEGRGTKKRPVLALVQRDGNARSKPVTRVSQESLHAEVKKVVDKDATLLTDQWSGYAGLGDHFGGGHFTVNHTAKEYVRHDKDAGLPVHTNTVESFFSLMKRGYMGIYHQMSHRHLHRYCAEFDFRWNHRKGSDQERMDAAIRRIGGKRLLYETPENDG